ncbi:MAG: oxygenase MpaB family protein [Polyangiaceae bacterium]
MRTARWDREIARLNRERDAEAIARILGNHVFPLEVLVALEVAQLRTFTIPTISRILHATGQYERDGLKRLDDTRAILLEVLRPGLDSEASRTMVGHLNDIHGLYRISNDDFLYTLSTFVFDPPGFIAKWGHRPLTEHEQDAVFFVYRKLGEGMRIRDLPATRLEFLAWRRAYEGRVQGHSADNEAVGRGMLRTVARMFPLVPPALWEPLMVCLTEDDGFRTALGFAVPSSSFRSIFRKLARAYRALSRRVNPFEHRAFWDTRLFNGFSTYPGGYEALRLGPTQVMATLDRRRKQPTPL